MANVEKTKLPLWRVWCPDHGEDIDDCIEFRAWFAEDAAEAWADDYDCQGDYTIVGGDPAKVIVVGEDGLVQRFEVSGEAEPRYTAHAIDPEGAP